MTHPAGSDPRWPSRPPSKPHPRLLEAGEGRLPAWANVSGERMAHLRRVMALMDDWAGGLGVPEEERYRWRAAGLLHDALKGVEPAELRIWAGPDLPEPILHGPACGGRLREEGVRDEEVLLAIAYHSIGHPSFTPLGECLYVADYVDPGRRSRRARRASLRDRMPEERTEVVLEVAGLRMRDLLEKRRQVLPASVQFWNRRVAGAAERAARADAGTPDAPEGAGR